MMGLSKSRSPNPTARSMARLGERCTPCVMVWLRRSDMPCKVRGETPIDMTAQNAIRTRALRKVYPAAGNGGGTGGIVALDGLDLEVRAGEFFGLLGPNGAGKTTTIGILTTRVRPTSGSAEVAGADVVAAPVIVKQRIGVVPQRPNPDRSLSVLENLVFHAAYFGLSRKASAERARGLLEMLGLGERADAKVDEISGGQQQRLMIARALIHDPQVLFLDEPTVGLDPQARLELWQIVRGLHAEARTVVMRTQYTGGEEWLCASEAIDE